MFDERAALRLRLEQMKGEEERVLQTLQREREYIFNRLKKLDDEALGGPISIQSEMAEEDFPKRKSRPSRRSKTTKMREVAVTILKEHGSPIRGIDLKREIEDRAGHQIANMTTFMNTITKADPNITKIRRGLYKYQEEESFINPIYLEAGEQSGKFRKDEKSM